MKKCYCDLCGKETSPSYEIYAYADESKIIHKREVCKECLGGFKQVIKNYTSDRSK